MQLHGFLSEKMSQKKKRKPGWTDISGPGPVSFLSRSSMYYIMLTLHNPIKPLNIVSTNSFPWGPNYASSATSCTKRPETAATCPTKQFRNNSLFSVPICQEEINKVIFAWVYELENNFRNT